MYRTINTHFLTIHEAVPSRARLCLVAAMFLSESWRMMDVDEVLVITLETGAEYP